MILVDRKYQTGLRRIAAAISDAIIMTLPFIVISANGISIPEGFQKTYMIFQVLFPILYSIGMHYQYGQTLGKMVMGIKVIDVSETQSLTLKQAVARDSIWLLIKVIGLLSASIFIVFENLGLTSLYFVLQFLSNSFVTIWAVLEILSMFTNKKRRAIHDFLAKTVVVREEYVKLYKTS